MFDAVEINGFCPVCCQGGQKIKVGWLNFLCCGCGYSFSCEARNKIVENRRKLLGLSRETMSEKVGLSTKTIADYERRWPSKKYWILTQKLMMEIE